MANYPDIPQSYDSKILERNAFVVDFSDDNTPWIRNFSAQKVYQITLVHSLITAAELQTLEDFFDSNQSLYVTLLFKLDSKSYTCRFTAPIQKGRDAGSFWQAQVQLVGSLA